MYTVTLTQNRHPGPRRYAHLILYRREGNRVDAYRMTEDAARSPAMKIDRVEWRDIAPSQVDPEFQSVWLEHVSRQRDLQRA